jgi:hypothetical protein
MKKSLLVCIHSLDLCFPQSQNYKKKILVEICPRSPRDICYMDPIFPYIYSLIQILGGGARDDDRMLMEKDHKIISHKGCVTLWPCHLHQKVS